MKSQITPLARRGAPPVPDGQESVQLDRLVQEYLVWSAEALDVLVALYEAVDQGGDAPAEATRFAERIGAWEDQLSDVLGRLSAKGNGGRARIAAVV